MIDLTTKQNVEAIELKAKEAKALADKKAKEQKE